MLRDGLFTKFPKPDYALALHDNAGIPAGKVAWKEGPLLASSDSVDIIVRGVGGHGAAPHQTKDPIVIAAQVVRILMMLFAAPLMARAIASRNPRNWANTARQSSARSTASATAPTSRACWTKASGC